MPRLFTKKELALFGGKPRKKRKFKRDPRLRYRGIPIPSDNRLHFRDHSPHDTRSPGINPPDAVCAAEGCNELINDKFGRYCPKHRMRYSSWGDPLEGFSVRKWVIVEAIKVTKVLLKHHVSKKDNDAFNAKIKELTPSMRRPRSWLPSMADWSIDIQARQQSKVGHALLWHRPRNYVRPDNATHSTLAMGHNFLNTLAVSGMIGCSFAKVSAPEFWDKRIRYLAGNVLHNSMHRTWKDASAPLGEVEFDLSRKAKFWLGDDYMELVDEIYGSDFWDRELTLDSGRTLTFREFMHETMNNVFLSHKLVKFDSKKYTERIQR